MATCKDCIHYSACDYHIDEETVMTVEECGNFKNKADFVEVVRCKSCQSCVKVNDLDNGHWECIAHYDLHGKPYIPDLDGFCSDGKRRDT